MFRAAARTGTAMEIDSFPDRLDLPADLIRRAKRFGVRFSVDTDAHSLGHHRNIRYGVGTAQRGWLTPDDVINTWPLERLRRLTGRLARENAQRNPGRTAVTAAALMIGLALVAFVTVFAAGLKSTVARVVDENFAGGLVIQNSNGFGPIPAGARRPGSARSRIRKTASRVSSFVFRPSTTPRTRLRGEPASAIRSASFGP